MGVYLFVFFSFLIILHYLFLKIRIDLYISSNYKIVLIGAGNVATHLGQALQELER